MLHENPVGNKTTLKFENCTNRIKFPYISFEGLDNDS